MNLFDLLFEEIIIEAFIPPWGKKQDLDRGRMAEDVTVPSIVKFNDMEFALGSKEDDRIRHFDARITSGNTGKTYKIEIKSKENIMTEDMLVELVGGKGLGNFNHQGWLYGEADFLAYAFVVPSTSQPLQIPTPADPSKKITVYDPHVVMLVSRPKLAAVLEAKTGIKLVGRDNVYIPPETPKVFHSLEARMPAIYKRSPGDDVITRMPVSLLKTDLKKDTDWFLLRMVSQQGLQNIEGYNATQTDPKMKIDIENLKTKTL